MRVIFLYGPAASGKHTIGSLLSEKLNWPLFHNHLTVDLVLSLFEFGSAEFVRLRAAIWKEAFRSAANANQSFIFTFFPEKTVQVDTIPQLQEIIEDSGGEVQYIQLLCSEPEVERRLSEPSRAQFGKLQDPDLYRELRESGQFDYPHIPEAQLTINTQAMDANTAAEHIAQYLNDLD